MRDSIATAATLKAHANVAAPHDIVGGQVRVIENMSVDPVASAGAVWSSVSDMAKWMQFLLDGGRIGGSGGKRLIGEATFAELFKPQTIAPFDMYPTTSVVKPHWMTYGLGWFQQDYRGRAVDFHTGSIDGMTAIHGLMRDDRLGVYVLANLDHAELRHALMYTVFDRYSGAPERDWSGELLKLYTGIRRQADETREKEEAKRVRGTTPSLPLAQYAGTYSDPLRGDVEVTPDRRRPATSLWARFRRSTRALALQHVSREMDGRVARTGAGHVRAECRGQAGGRRAHGRSFRPSAVASPSIVEDCIQRESIEAGAMRADDGESFSRRIRDRFRGAPGSPAPERCPARRHRSFHHTNRHRLDRSIRCFP